MRVKDKLVEGHPLAGIRIFVVNYASGDMVGHTGVCRAIESCRRLSTNLCSTPWRLPRKPATRPPSSSPTTAMPTMPSTPTAPQHRPLPQSRALHLRDFAQGCHRGRRQARRYLLPPCSRSWASSSPQEMTGFAPSSTDALNLPRGPDSHSLTYFLSRALFLSTPSTL